MTFVKYLTLVLAALVLGLAGYVTYSTLQTQSELAALEDMVREAASPRSPVDPSAMAALPDPVRAYLDFACPDLACADIAWVEVAQSGQFRRPLTEGFAPTTARQVLGTAAPDLMFSANTPMAGVFWAIAFDHFQDGEMQMEARLLSTMTVMREESTPVLDRISLRRWLLESPMNPAALLPGGIVTWEPIDATRARAVVRAHGIEAALVATFGPNGALLSFEAAEDGDLTTPYHGSGEFVTRGDYREVEGVMIPMSFEISRRADGQLYPFWRGEVTEVTFGRAPS